MRRIVWKWVFFCSIDESLSLTWLQLIGVSWNTQLKCSIKYVIKTDLWSLQKFDYDYAIMDEMIEHIRIENLLLIIEMINCLDIIIHDIGLTSILLDSDEAF